MPVGERRGPGFPDDIVWLEPHERRVTTWLLGDGLLALDHSSRVGQRELGLMSKAIIVLTLAVASACGPHVDDEDLPPGELVYEDSFKRLYLLDRRVEVIYDHERQDGLEGKCGVLTDRAYEELESTLAALDPSVDYGYDPDVLECERSPASVHIDGFEHSPFACGFSCCHRDLYPAVFVYTMILNNFIGLVPDIDGEPYVAIEPDVPCP